VIVGHLDCLEFKVLVDCQDFLDQKAQLEKKASQENQECLEMMDIEVTVVARDPEDHQVQWVKRET